MIYQRRKVTSVTLHHRPQLPFIECLVFTVEAKAGLRLFWEPWPEQRQIEKGTFAMKHTLSVSLSLNWRKAPPLHRNTASFCPSVSVSLRWGRHLFAIKASLEDYYWNTEFLSHSNIYLLYILTLISIDEKGIRFPTISKIDSGTYIRCAWSTSKWWHYFNTVNISNTWCFWPRAQIVLFQTINSKFKLAQCFTELQLVMWRQCNGVNISQTWRLSQITVSAHHQLLHFFTDSLFQFFGCQSIDTFSGQCNVIPTLDLPLRNWQYKKWSDVWWEIKKLTTSLLVSLPIRPIEMCYRPKSGVWELQAFFDNNSRIEQMSL